MLPTGFFQLNWLVCRHTSVKVSSKFVEKCRKAQESLENLKISNICVDETLRYTADAMERLGEENQQPTAPETRFFPVRVFFECDLTGMRFLQMFLSALLLRKGHQTSALRQMVASRATQTQDGGRRTESGGSCSYRRFFVDTPHTVVLRSAARTQKKRARCLAVVVG